MPSGNAIVVCKYGYGTFPIERGAFADTCQQRPNVFRRKRLAGFSQYF